MHHDQLIDRRADFGQPLGVERPRLDLVPPVPHPKERHLGSGAQGQPHDKPRRRRDIGGVAGVDFMHRASRQPAPQSGIDRAGAQGEDAMPPGCDAGVEPHESLPQRTQLKCSVHGPYVPYLFYLDSEQTKSQSAWLC